MVVGDRVKVQKNIYFYAIKGNKMTEQFHRFKKFYQDGNFEALLSEEKGIYWLKLRSISRKALMIDFCNYAQIDCKNIKTNKLFEYIYQKKINKKALDKFIAKKYKEERLTRKKKEAEITSELYKLKVFDWGGLYQNNLERTIVNNYIKKIDKFSLLNKKIEGEIHESMRSYVLSPWYNHWTSILIEDIFKDHKKVTPTIGLVKKIDFFIENIPFDLKVTHFPDGFMQAKRKELGLNTELQELKKFAREKGIKYNHQQKDKSIFIELLTRFDESMDTDIKQFWKKFCHTRRSIIKATIQNPKELICWLYEQQGERRFDSSNRLFLILVDENNLEESWKMKRNINLLKTNIKKYLDHFNLKDMKELKINFKWKDGKQYSAFSDLIFINKK